MSSLKDLFLEIQEHIQRHVPEVTWIDQDLGQLEHYDTRPAVSFPCVLIDFDTVQNQMEGGLSVWSTITIQIRLAFSPFSSANSIAPDISKENALAFYDIEQKLFKFLHGWMPLDDTDQSPKTQPFTWIQSNSERRTDPIRVRVMLFNTATEDNTAMKDYTKLQPGLVINATIGSD